MLPYLQDALGEHIGANMARTARMLREDVELLAALAGRELQAAGEGASLNCTELQQQPAALRRRVLKQWLADKAGPLTSAHLNAIDALVIAWKGQGGAAVPWPQNLPASTEQRRTHRLVVQRRDGYLQLATVPR